MISTAALPPAPMPKPVTPWSVLTIAMMAEGNCSNGPPQRQRRGSSSPENVGASSSPSERWLM